MPGSAASRPGAQHEAGGGVGPRPSGSQGKTKNALGLACGNRDNLIPHQPGGVLRLPEGTRRPATSLACRWPRARRDGVAEQPVLLRPIRLSLGAGAGAPDRDGLGLRPAPAAVTQSNPRSSRNRRPRPLHAQGGLQAGVLQSGPASSTHQVNLRAPRPASGSSHRRPRACACPNGAGSDLTKSEDARLGWHHLGAPLDEEFHYLPDQH